MELIIFIIAVCVAAGFIIVPRYVLPPLAEKKMAKAAENVVASSVQSLSGLTQAQANEIDAALRQMSSTTRQFRIDGILHAVNPGTPYREHDVVVPVIKTKRDVTIECVYWVYKFDGLKSAVQEFTLWVGEEAEPLTDLLSTQIWEAKSLLDFEAHQLFFSSPDLEYDEYRRSDISDISVSNNGGPVVSFTLGGKRSWIRIFKDSFAASQWYFDSFLKVIQEKGLSRSTGKLSLETERALDDYPVTRAIAHGIETYCQGVPEFTWTKLQKSTIMATGYKFNGIPSLHKSDEGYVLTVDALDAKIDVVFLSED